MKLVMWWDHCITPHRHQFPECGKVYLSPEIRNFCKIVCQSSACSLSLGVWVPGRGSRGTREKRRKRHIWPIILWSRDQWDFSKDDFHLSMKFALECITFAMHGMDCMRCWATGLLCYIYAHIHWTCISFAKRK